MPNKARNTKTPNSKKRRSGKRGGKQKNTAQMQPAQATREEGARNTDRLTRETDSEQEGEVSPVESDENTDGQTGEEAFIESDEDTDRQEGEETLIGTNEETTLIPPNVTLRTNQKGQEKAQDTGLAGIIATLMKQIADQNSDREKAAAERDEKRDRVMAQLIAEAKPAQGRELARDAPKITLGESMLVKQSIKEIGSVTIEEMRQIQIITPYLIKGQELMEDQNFSICIKAMFRGCRAHPEAARMFKTADGPGVTEAQWHTATKDVLSLLFDSEGGAPDVMRTYIDNSSPRETKESLDSYYARYNRLFSQEAWIRHLHALPRDACETKRRITKWVDGLNSQWARLAARTLIRTQPEKATLNAIHAHLAYLILAKPLNKPKESNLEKKQLVDNDVDNTLFNMTPEKQDPYRANHQSPYQASHNQSPQLNQSPQRGSYHQSPHRNNYRPTGAPEPCRNFQRGICSRNPCRYSHDQLPTQNDNTAQQAGHGTPTHGRNNDGRGYKERYGDNRRDDRDQYRGRSDQRNSKYPRDTQGRKTKDSATVSSNSRGYASG